MYAVWIDREKARLFLKEGDEFRQLAQVDADCGPLKLGSENPHFQQLAAELKPAKNIFLIGPGISKHHFRIYLMEQHPALAKKVAILEQVDASLEREVEKILNSIFAKNTAR